MRAWSRKDLLVQGVFFRVDGADIESGQETFLILRAASADDAEDLARKQGMLIASVRPANDADWQAMPAAGAVKKAQAAAAPATKPPPGLGAVFADSKPVTAQTKAAVAPVVRGEAGKRPPHRVPPPARPPGFHAPAPRMPVPGAPVAPAAPMVPPPPAEATAVHPPAVDRLVAPESDQHGIERPSAVPRVEPVVPAEPAERSRASSHQPVPISPPQTVSAAETVLPQAPEPAIWEHAPTLVAGAVTVGGPPKVEPAPGVLPPVAAAMTVATAPVAPSRAVPAPIPASAVAAPANAPIPSAGGGNWLASVILSPLAFLSLAGGVGVLVYSFNRSEPADATDLQKLDLHVQSLTQSFLGGMLVLAGLLLFVAAGMVYVGGGLRNLRRK